MSSIERLSTANLIRCHPKIRHVNGKHAEETDEDVEVEEEEAKAPTKAENNMNARRWKWEVLDT